MKPWRPLRSSTVGERVLSADEWVAYLITATKPNHNQLGYRWVSRGASRPQWSHRPYQYQSRLPKLVVPTTFRKGTIRDRPELFHQSGLFPDFQTAPPVLPFGQTSCADRAGLANSSALPLCRNQHTVSFSTRETDQPVRLGPERRLPTIKTAGFPQSSLGVFLKLRKSHRDQAVSLRPKRLTRRAADQIPLIQGIYGRPTRPLTPRMRGI